MNVLLVLALALAVPAAAPVKPAPPPAIVNGGTRLDCGALECWRFRKPADAFAEVLRAKPLILGVGEYHEIEGGKRVKSAIKRFTETMLPQLGDRASDLIAETWMITGKCGEPEKQASQEIEKETQRPESTEDEVTTMLERSSELGIQPHILSVACEDYQSLLQPDGSLDDERLLQFVTGLLRKKATEYFGKRPAADQTVVIYGGALHNDVAPAQEYAAYSFAADLQKVADGRYVELDLYVPEFMLRDDDVKKEAWFPYYQRYGSRTSTLLFRRSPSSFLVIFPRSR